MSPNIITGILLINLLHAKCQVGVENLCLGNTTLSNNVWAVTNNPGCFGQFKQTKIAFQYQDRFLTKPLSSHNLAIGHHTKNGNFGAFILHNGFSLYQQLQIGMAYAMPLSSNFFMGISTSLHQTKLGDIYGSTQYISFGLGINYKINKQLQFGFNIQNISRSKLTANKDERLPTNFNMGINYQLNENIKWLVELKKDLLNPVNLKAGLEVGINHLCDIRLGINTYPFQSGFGFGFSYKKLSFDLGSIWQAKLGLSPSIGLTYQAK